MFEPPRCPYAACPRHADPGRNFYVRHGSYTARVHTFPVPRFRCRSCLRTFSRQTFRLSFRDRKPHLNPPVLKALTGGSWFRKTARDLSLTRNNLEAKARKLFRHARNFNRNMLRRGLIGPRLVDVGKPFGVQFDEYESYETRRNTRPVTIATAIETTSRFMIATIVAPIRPHGRMTKQRKAAIAADEARFGRRPHLSTLACRIALRRADAFRQSPREVALATDEKWTYPEVARAAFHRRLLVHWQRSSRAPRGIGTLLSPINQVENKARMHVGRTQREMMYVTKERRYLGLHLELHVAYRNWMRPRFYKRQERTPAELAGYAWRRMRLRELIGWRQDWGPRSPCPFGHGLRTVGEAPRSPRRAA
jgi:transposase-like protein